MKPNRFSAFNFLAGLRACGLAGLRACGLALLLGLAPSVWAQNNVSGSGEAWVPRSLAPSANAAAPHSTSAQTCTYFNAFKDNGDGTVTDPRSATVWQRCVIGQTWNGMECVGQGKEMPWAEAFVTAKADRFLKQADWRLPTKNEAESVVGARRSDCGNGSRYASALLSAGVVWTSTPHEIHTNYVWYVSFGSGSVNSNIRSGNLNGRLVRAGLPSSVDEFNREFVTHEAILADAKRKEQLERDQATAKAAAEARLERETAFKAAEAARKQRDYENSPAGKAEKRKQEREAVVQAQRERVQAAAQQQQERDQAASNAANEARNNAQATNDTREKLNLDSTTEVRQPTGSVPFMVSQGKGFVNLISFTIHEFKSQDTYFQGTAIAFRKLLENYVIRTSKPSHYTQVTHH